MIKKNKVLLSILASMVLLASCNSGSNNSNPASPIVNNSPLAQYKAMLNYSSNNTTLGLKAGGDTKQQSFVVPESGLTLNSIRVTLFSSTNCAFGTESAILTMNGDGGVNFPAGTYTSSNASNYALAQRFSSESTYVAFNAKSVRFDYFYNSANSGPGWVSANCMESTGIGNYDTNNVCSDNTQPCGFKILQVANLPESFLRAIFLTAQTYRGDLKTAGGGADGYVGADNLCNKNSNKPARGAGSTWKAIITYYTNSNNATESGIYYYRSDYTTRIGRAYGGGMLNRNAANTGFATGAPITLESSISASNFAVWTGSSTRNCSYWTNSGINNGLSGQSNVADANWASTTNDKCNALKRLYCAQQPN
ncbi:MAG: hypothetical protein E6Q33_02235 [Neisseriales bacterium]|nr:MAG: hypothetical protein E6Q33_02235 [Neisseriales bacterium]